MPFATLDQKAVDRFASRLQPAERQAVNLLIVEINDLLRLKGVMDSRIASSNAYIAEIKKDARESHRRVLEQALVSAPVLITAALLPLTRPCVKKFIKEKLEDKVSVEVARFSLGEKEAIILERSLDFIGYFGIKATGIVRKFSFGMAILTEFFKSTEANPGNDEKQIAAELDEQIAAKLSILIAILGHDDPYLGSAIRALNPPGSGSQLSPALPAVGS